MNPVQFYKCLADDTRLRCLLLIQQEQELCVCELTEALQQSQPKISRHLAQLRQVGLLKDHRRGQWVFYAISESLPQWCHTVLAETAAHNQSLISDCQAQLKAMADRPGRCS